MTVKPDDLEAVRTLIETLKSFDVNDQKRILRWTQEKLGIVEPASGSGEIKDNPPQKKEEGGKVDIKTLPLLNFVWVHGYNGPSIRHPITNKRGDYDGKAV